MCQHFGFCEVEGKRKLNNSHPVCELCHTDKHDEHEEPYRPLAPGVGRKDRKSSSYSIPDNLPQDHNKAANSVTVQSITVQYSLLGLCRSTGCYILWTYIYIYAAYMNCDKLRFLINRDELHRSPWSRIEWSGHLTIPAANLDASFEEEGAFFNLSSQFAGGSQRAGDFDSELLPTAIHTCAIEIFFPLGLPP